VHAGTAGFADPLVGSMVQTPAGAEIAFRDSVDPALTVTIMPPDARGLLPMVTVERSGVQVCSVPARVTQTIYAVCGTTRMVIGLYGSAAHLTGLLTTSGVIR
jgi:hypothetical protein